jgi:dihydroflavonol-4-reductase
MTVLVTGGAGFIGSRLVEALLTKGERVRVYDLRAGEASRLADLGAELVAGDILDRGRLRTALDGCNSVFHLAALLSMWETDPAVHYRNNVEGTGSVLESALEAGVERIIHTSSAVTIGEAQGQIGNEQTAHRGYFLSRYERSKYLGEQVALDLCGRGLPVLIVNPTTVYGPGQTVNQTGAIIRLLQGRLPIVANAQFNYVYVDDVVRGHLAAMELGSIGERYILGGQNVTMVEFFSMAGEIARVSARPRAVPGLLLKSAALALGAASLITRRRPAICIDEAKTASHSFIMDTRKATEELVLEWTPLRVGLERTVNWLQREGLTGQANA